MFGIILFIHSRCEALSHSIPPLRFVISHRYSSVPVDLMNPSSGRSISNMLLVGWWPDNLSSA